MNADELAAVGLKDAMISMRAVVCVDTMSNAKVGLQLAPVATKDLAGRAIQWGLTSENDPDMPAKMVSTPGRRVQYFKVNILVPNGNKLTSKVPGLRGEGDCQHDQ